MFIQSKLFKFILPLLAYLLFAFQWAYNYLIVWYANIPQETENFKNTNIGFHMGYAYLLMISLIIFISFGIVYLKRNPTPKFIKYILLSNLFLSSFYVFHYSYAMKSLHIGGIFTFLILTMFAYSIFNLSKVEITKVLNS